jgi:hypothetical protein
LRVFLTHASEDDEIAESLAYALRARGHGVFLDRHDLPPGSGFDQQIENGVKQSDILVFLISPNSVANGRYTLTELTFAKQKWKAPDGRVLPVMARKTPLDQIPPYLKAVSILEPAGNLAAEVASMVDTMAKSVQPPAGVPPPAVIQKQSSIKGLLILFLWLAIVWIIIMAVLSYLNIH